MVTETKPEGNGEKLITYDELADTLSVSKPTLYRRVAEDPQFPCVRISPKCVRFSLRAVLAHLQRTPCSCTKKLGLPGL